MDLNGQLASELAAIAGVEDAELSYGDTGVTGVRVTLQADADPEGVGRAVQEVMTRHGVRARLGNQAPPPSPSGAVVSLADRAEASQLAPIGDAALSGVAVNESGRGLEVAVTTADGRTETQRCLGDDRSIAEAVTLAAARLHGGDSAVLVEYLRQEIADTDVVTVVVDSGGEGLRAGSAVVGAGFAYAVARAVWAALGA